MKLVVPIASSIVGRTKRHISFAFKGIEVQRLNDALNKLKSKRDDLALSIDIPKSKGEEFYEYAMNWLIRADKCIGEASELIERKRNLIALSPKRYQLNKKAMKIALTIYHLINELPDLSSISCSTPPAAAELIMNSSSSSGYNHTLPSRVSILKEVMNVLADHNLDMIGVYGIGGVGKTTLAKEIQRQAIEEELFNVVVMVTVSQKPDLNLIQKKIADVLDIKLLGEEAPRRASQLYSCLKSGRKKILIILDNVWKKLDLKAMGIPFGDECKGCKVLLTSRSKDVLSCEMGTQKEFELKVLQEEEAWSLFEATVADGKATLLPAIATQVAQRCAGLPLLIVKVAMDLRNKESFVWNDKLMQLSEFENLEKVWSVLESSYNDLPNEEVKSLFLLCGLFGQSDIQIENLVRYSAGLALFKRADTLVAERNRVNELISDLKAKYLYQDGDIDGFVKMHDIVCDVAVSIASKEQHVFIGTSGIGLREWPLENCTRISLPYCDISELCEGLKFPEAELFLLFSDGGILNIPDLFFEEIPKLKVLDFSGMSFRSLPSSLGLLTNLQTLHLHQCELGNVAIIGKLKQLQVLSFAYSNLVELPRQIEELTGLKLLDLSYCSKLQFIPANVLSKLSLLEELYIIDSFVQWEVKRIKNEGNASLAELEDLSHLTTLEILAPDAEMIPKTLFSCGLERYRIYVGDWWYWNQNHDASRILRLRQIKNIHLYHGIKLLLKGTEDLYLDGVSGIENVLYDPECEGFQRLKQLHIQNDPLIHFIIISTKLAAFPLLESLSLNELVSLEKICHGQLGVSTFGKLRNLDVRSCIRLENLFSSYDVKCLSQLTEMTVNDCDRMEEIIVLSKGDNEVVEFKQLCSLRLVNLPRLRSFCKEEDELGAPLSLFNRKVSFPNLEHLELRSIACENLWHNELCISSNLTSLTVEHCQYLNHLFTTSLVKNLLKLKTLEIYQCKYMKEIIHTEDVILAEGIIVAGEIKEEEGERMNKPLLPKLNILRLRNLPNLMRFCTGHPFEFPSLTELDIANCFASDALRTFMQDAQHSQRINITESELHKMLADSLGLLVTSTQCEVWIDDKKVKLRSEDEDEEEDEDEDVLAGPSDTAKLLRPIQEDICDRMAVASFSAIQAHLVEEQAKEFNSSPQSSKDSNAMWLEKLPCSTAILSHSKDVVSHTATTNTSHDVAIQYSSHKTRTDTIHQVIDVADQSFSQDGVQKLNELPTDIESLRIVGCDPFTSEILKSNRLQHLDLVDCCSLESLPDGEYLADLKTLHIKNCKKLEFPLSSEIMRNLEILCIESSCDNSLTFFPLNLFPRLRILCLFDCGKLEYLSIEEGLNQKELTSLEALEIRDCPNLTSFPLDGLPAPNLTSIYLFNCKILKSLPRQMYRLTSLLTLYISKCPELESLPTDLPTSLSLLCITSCDNITLNQELKLSKLDDLDHLEIEGGCENVETFPEKGLLPANLTTLSIRRLPNLRYLDEEGLQQLTALKNLEIKSCEEFCSLPEELPSSLSTLSIQQCPLLTEVLQDRYGTDWYNIAHIPNIYLDDKRTISLTT